MSSPVRHGRSSAFRPDETIDGLTLDTVGFVRWWREEVPLVNGMLHCLSDTTRHAGHADILREGLDGSVGVDAGTPAYFGREEPFWKSRRETIEATARAWMGRGSD